MNLKEQREQWESGEVICEMNDQGHDDTLLVVLKENDLYDCHRYFRRFTGVEVKPVEEEQWEVSVDCQNVNADIAFAWLADPKAQPINT